MSLRFGVDSREVNAALDKLMPRERNKVIAEGAREGAKFLKPRLKARLQADYPGMKRLQKAAYRGTAKVEKPGAFVAIRGGKRGAFYRDWVIRGTADRFTKSSHAFRGHVTGRGDPVAEVTASDGPRALELAMGYIKAKLGL